MSDLWLIQAPWPDGGADPFASLRGAPDLRVWRALEGSEACATLPLAAREAGLAHVPRGLALTRTLEIRGAAAGAPTAFHYIVATDVLPEQEADFNAWYDEEHLPGLAAVPGTVRAARYTNRDGSPRYFACYDLATLDAFNSPPWLAVRGTAWSGRVRPAFRNTRRTMFRPG